ncbi:MAG: PP2C family protein-serine/threonine phosphatase [Spirulina sp. SIO3F2]|nr:PP2C family protein-serine/threonine phosphatase [Spirulina sp. SIO3F2]
MISLGNIFLDNQDSITEVRKKILSVLKILTGDRILATRIASVTSQMGRSLYHGPLKSQLVFGLFRGSGGVGFSITFMTQKKLLKTDLTQAFFDEICSLSPKGDWNRVQGIIWLDTIELPSPSVVEKIRNILKGKNRQQLMAELEQNNQKLSKSLHELQKTTLLKDKMSSLNVKLKQENLRMGAQLELLREMQQLILPKLDELASIEDLDIAGFMEPADEVGGDYYDVLYTDGVVTIAIGDVTGHGLESGILMVMTQAAVRTLQGIKENDPIRFLNTLNQVIYDNIQRMESEKNLTLAILNYRDRKVSVSGQHEETILFRKGGEIERVDTMHLGFPVGLCDDIAEFIDHYFFELDVGDGIVLYTDGVVEAMDFNKKQYGIERLCEMISHYSDRSAEEIQKVIIQDVYQHIGEQKVLDDITLLVLKQN